jgi:hypothetical protein
VLAYSTNVGLREEVLFVSFRFDHVVVECLSPFDIGSYALPSSQGAAFMQLRDLLCSELLLQYPDFAKPFVVTTDASGYAIGGILSQGTIGRDLPVAYTSRLLSKAEQNYSTIEKELLAIM